MSPDGLARIAGSAGDPVTSAASASASAAAAAAAETAVKVAASLGVRGTDPVILADGANVIVDSPGDALPDEATIGSMLRDLHAALRGYPGQAPVLAPLGNIPAFLARPHTAELLALWPAL